MNIKEYSKEQLKEYLDSSNSYSEFLDNINYAKSGGAYRYTKKYLKSIGLDYTKLSNKRWDSTEVPVEEVFIEGTKWGTKELKNKINKYNLKDYKCQSCGNEGEWNGEKLILQLDHINGKRDDNRLENLRFLCPNCHSQTKTYSGKNNKK